MQQSNSGATPNPLSETIASTRRQQKTRWPNKSKALRSFVGTWATLCQSGWRRQSISDDQNRHESCYHRHSMDRQTDRHPLLDIHHDRHKRANFYKGAAFVSLESDDTCRKRGTWKSMKRPLRTAILYITASKLASKHYFVLPWWLIVCRINSRITSWFLDLRALKLLCDSEWSEDVFVQQHMACVLPSPVSCGLARSYILVAASGSMKCGHFLALLLMRREFFFLNRNIRFLFSRWGLQLREFGDHAFLKMEIKALLLATSLASATPRIRRRPHL